MITHNDLAQFGLSEKEARVYLASLALGPATATQISQKAGVNRATTYVELEALMNAGLMSTYEKGKTTLFSAESPEVLKRILEKRADDAKLGILSLEKLLPTLLTLYDYAEEKPKVRFFEGKEGLRTMQEDFLKTKDKNIEEISNLDEVVTVFTEAESRRYREARLRKKIHARILYTRAAPVTHTIPLTTARFIPRDTFPISSHIILYDNKVAIATLSKKLIGVIIEDTAIAHTMESVFELAWIAAAHYNSQ